MTCEFCDPESTILLAVLAVSFKLDLMLEDE